MALHKFAVIRQMALDVVVFFLIVSKYIKYI